LPTGITSGSVLQGCKLIVEPVRDIGILLAHNNYYTLWSLPQGSSLKKLNLGLEKSLWLISQVLILTNLDS